MSATILSRTGVKIPSSGQDPWGADADESLQLLGQDLSHWRIAPGKSESYVQGALAEAHDEGGGVIELYGDAYDASDADAFEILLPTVSFRGRGSGATVITYTGTGSCFRIHADPFTVQQAGFLQGLTVDGTGAGTGACAVHLGDVIGFGIDDLVVTGFDGAGQCPLWLDNVTDFTERLTVVRSHLDKGTVGMKFTVQPGADSSSFKDLQFRSTRINTLDGQVAVQLNDGAYLYQAHLGLSGNCEDDSTVFELNDTAGVQFCTLDLGFEQQAGGTGTRFKFNGTGGFDGEGVASFVGDWQDDVTDQKLLQLRGGDALNQQVTAPQAFADFLGSGTPVDIFIGKLLDNGADPKAVLGLLIGAGIRGPVLNMLNAAGNAVTFGKVAVGDSPEDMDPVLYVTVNGQIVAAPVGAGPSVTFYAGAGTSPPAAVIEASSDNLSGTFTAGSGTSPAVNAYCKVTLYGAFPGSKKPRVVITPTSAAAAALQAFVPPSAVTQNSFDLYLGVAPTASQANTVYGWTYHLLG